ncbi:hypothetical protein CSV77_07530 [Sporosarcina sp. P16b]|uniref:hypothetical protein n=1 Tax=Sporosarcina sp. P16b TaxID=2048261 RepID=UPI000C167CD2|nr:hypothetical protein [Sporosarcina sp. P16b]PIC70762.1 hypothetical protein CSV77_07530 [Sporosarcina sp. P16b]
MLRKLFYITFLAVILVGCQTADKNTTSNTPREALEQLHAEEGFAEVVKVYRTLEVDNNKVINVYKGILDGTEEIFIAKLNKEKDDTWTVTDAIGIGMPSEKNLGESVKTSSFEAGFTKKNNAPSPNTKLVQTDDKKYRVWVKVLE